MIRIFKEYLLKNLLKLKGLHMVNTAYSVARLSSEKVSSVEGCWDTRIQDIRRSARTAGYLPLPAGLAGQHNS